MSAKQLREAFAKKTLESAVIDIPGVGKVSVRELTLGELDSVDHSGTADARAKNLALALYTEDGSERVFDPDNDADIAIIKKLGMRNIINKLSAALAEKN